MCPSCTRYRVGDSIMGQFLLWVYYRLELAHSSKPANLKLHMKTLLRKLICCSGHDINQNKKLVTENVKSC